MFPTYILRKDSSYSIYNGTTYQIISGVVYLICRYPGIMEDDNALKDIPMNALTNKLLRCFQPCINQRLESIFKSNSIGE